MAARIRRIVTGHDEAGRSTVVTDGPARAEPLGDDGLVFHEIWHTIDAPATIALSPRELDERGISLLPPEKGTRIRFIDFPPEPEDLNRITPEIARASFAAIGAPEAAMHGGKDSPHPFMHRTRTVDYGIVLDGEIILVLDTGDIALQAGDVVVQNGTSHAWSNRSGRTCRMAFMLIDGRFDA